MIRNFTGRPIRFLSPTSPEIAPEGMASVVQLGRVERDTLLLDDGTPVPGTVSRASTKSLKADWIDQQIVFTINDAVIINGQVADFMELIGIKLDAEVWSPGFVKTSGEGVVYAPSPIRHKNLTRKRD